LAGGEVQQITRGTSPAFAVALSPDGREVAYHAIVNGQRRVFVASSEGGDQPVQVSPGASPDERNPTWSPDGRRLAWAAFANGLPVVQVAARTGNGWGAPHAVSSPGSHVFPTWGDTAQLLAVDTVIGRLVLVNADGASGPPRALTGVLSGFGAGFANPLASSDYRTLYLHDRHGLWALPSRGGAPREVVRFDDPLHPHATNARGVAGRAGQLYFTLQNPQSNIWIARVTGLKQ
jgi:hypothetical protein